MKNTSEQDLLSRLASKAKKKLNKTETQEENARVIRASYEFKTSNNKESEKILQKKIVQLLKNNPDCEDPIGRLIDHSIYDKLTSERKQAYILKLSKSYRDICAQLNG